MAKILNFGSINIDYVYHVPHFVRAGETLACNKREIFPGGKGQNQSVALAKAGAQVWHAGRVAPDALPLLHQMENAGVHTGLIDTTGTETGHAIIQVDENGQNCILISHAANYEITPEYIQKALAPFSTGDILVLQYEINNIALIIQEAHKRGLLIAFNPSPYADEIRNLPLDKITWFLMNEIEGKEITGKQNPDEILKTMLQQYPHARVLLTLGQHGSCYQDSTQRHTQPVFKVKAVDTTAAGDTFTGYFLSEIAAGHPVPLAMRKASLASAIAVSRAGATPSIPTLQEVSESKLTDA